MEELISERNYVLGELKAYEDLQLALEKIKRFNMENFDETTLKVYDAKDDEEPEESLEDIDGESDDDDAFYDDTKEADDDDEEDDLKDLVIIDEADVEEEA